MSRTNPFGTHPTAHGASSIEKVAHIVDVKNDRDADGKPRFRVKIRVEGDQRDQMAIPDENLQWVRVEMPVNSMGSSPYMKPGMRVRVKDLGGSPGSTGISPYVSSIVSYTPTNPENAEEQAVNRKEGVGPRQNQPPPNADFPQKRTDWPTEANTTNQTRHKDSYLPAQTKKADEAPHQAPNKNRHEENGTPSKAGGSLRDDDTMGSRKRQDNPDFQQQIKSLINNQGAFVPTALDMIQNLKRVTGGQNPTAVQAVGAGALAQAMSAISRQFASTRQEQIENRCAIENRPNLTPEELAICIELDELMGIAARESNGESAETLYPNTEPTYQKFDINNWDNLSANTIDSAAYQEAISNVVISLTTNTAFVNSVSSTMSNAFVLTNHSTPANSTVGGQVNNTIFFDDNFIYCVMANGYIKRATLNVF